MTPRDRQTAWKGAALLAAMALLVWAVPTEFEVTVFPGAGFAPLDEQAAGPEVPPGVFAMAGMVLLLGAGLVWYLPWLAQHLPGRGTRIVLAAACVALAGMGVGDVVLLAMGTQAVRSGLHTWGALMLLLGTGVALWLVAGVLGLVALVRGALRTPLPHRESAR